MPSLSDRSLGQWGEQVAAFYLERQGYQLLAKNIRFRFAELDLLMRQEETIVLVEVKSQAGGSADNLLYRINPRKQRKLLWLAKVMAGKYPDQPLRIDTVTVCRFPSKVQITHLPNSLFL